MFSLTAAEKRYCDDIKIKDCALRTFLSEHTLSSEVDPARWLSYLTSVKTALGNLSNDLGFIAILLVKRYLEGRFGITNFDAASKAQGAAGIDVEAQSSDGRKIVGEIKTTKPYKPGFGAQQRTTILKDLTRLAASAADHRFMFVTDAEAFAILCKPIWTARAPGIEIVDLVTGQTFTCPIVCRLLAR